MKRVSWGQLRLSRASQGQELHHGITQTRFLSNGNLMGTWALGHSSACFLFEWFLQRPSSSHASSPLQETKPSENVNPKWIRAIKREGATSTERLSLGVTQNPSVHREESIGVTIRTHQLTAPGVGLEITRNKGNCPAFPTVLGYIQTWSPRMVSAVTIKCDVGLTGLETGIQNERLYAQDLGISDRHCLSVRW